MYFTSLYFIVFLAVVLAGYFLVFKKYQWQFLLAASFVFYAFSGWSNLVYIALTIVSTYIAGRCMNRLLTRQNSHLAQNQTLAKEDVRAYKASVKKQRRRWLIACLVFNFALLAIVKYADFAIFNFNSLLNLFGNFEPVGMLGLLLPLGISFYTFQTMGYIIDVYRSKDEAAAENNIFRLALFTSFFPQLIQGPISRYKDLKKTLYGPNPFNPAAFQLGLMRTLFGFFKKMVVADRLMIPVRALIATNEYQGIYVIVAVFLYAVTLYSDFTGGIDIAIGIAQMLGIQVTENFNRPFYSKNIAEYWRRWHITMGTWFRDYVFYPLSVSGPMLRLQKKCRAKLGEAIGKRVTVYWCNLVVWFTTGLWHGASWGFIVWGLVNGVIIIISQEFSPLYAKFHKAVPLSNTKGYNAFQIFRTFWLMSFIRAFDIYGQVGRTFAMVGSIFTNFSLGQFMQNGLAPLGLNTAGYVVAFAGVALMVIVGVVAARRGREKPLPAPARYAIYFILLFAIIIFGTYGIGYDANQFIYNQF